VAHELLAELGSVMSWRFGCRAFLTAPVLGVDPHRFLKFVFQDDDAAGGVERGAVVDEFAGAGGDPQLVAGVAAVSAG
jgi:hypothetical protein